MRLLSGYRRWQICYRVIDGVDVFFDAVSLTAPSNEDHFKRLRAVLERFKNIDLHINVAKSQFLVPEIDFLGYHVSSKGISK